MRLLAPRKRSAAIALSALALLGAGYVAGQSHQPPAARALGPEYCRYSTETRYLSGGGSYLAVTAVVAEWNDLGGRWRAPSDYSARQTIGGFSCEREY